MRTLLAILVTLTFFSAKVQAQSHLPIGGWGYGFTPWQPFVTSLPSFQPVNNGSKWQLRSFSSVSLGYLFSGGGSMSYISAPVGLVLYHPLTSNLTAFGAATVAPTIFSINQLSAAPT